MSQMAKPRTRDDDRPLRERILDAGRARFARDGFERLTMRALAGDLGCTATAIYKHFADKLALMQEICDHDLASLQAAFAAAARVVDPLARLKAIGQGYAAFALANPHHYRLLFMTPLADDAARAALEVSRTRRGDPAQDGYAALAATVAEAIGAGLFAARWRDRHLAAQTLWAGLHGAVSLELDKGNDPWVPWRPATRRMAAMVDLLVDGMRGSP
ncbi:MAG TPA: TetR/AcrR family transcriptional regulator [Planctomycetota bacterium]|nr:TetR/AcrR family transcriptional regulator [Planctomycetota bacterium]